MSPERRTEDNWEQTRARVDAGETQDKAAAPDPAAAPLGADEEAGGSRTSPEAIARSARAQEQRPEPRDPGAERAGGVPGRRPTWVIVGVIGALVLAAVVGIVLVA